MHLRHLCSRAVLLALLLAVTALPHLAVAGDAILRLEPAQSLVPDGQSFEVDIVLGTGGERISAVSAAFSFDPTALEVRAANPLEIPGASWSLLPTAAGNGSLPFSFTADPPLAGDMIRMVRLTVVRRAGVASATLRFIAGAALVAGENGGTNVLVSGAEGIYVRPAPTATPEALVSAEPLPEASEGPLPSEVYTPPRAPRVSSPTHAVDALRSSDASWISARVAEFNWSAEPTARGFSYVLDHESATLPDTVPEGPQSAAVFKDLDDGLWVFHVRAEGPGGWSDPAHYGIRVDGTAPGSCKAVRVDEGADSFRIRAEATDALSGVAEYALEVAAGVAQKVPPADMASGVSLDIPRGLANAVKVTARDRAGNTCDMFVSIPGRMQTPLAITVPPSQLSVGTPCYAEGTAPAGAYVLLAIAPEGGTPDTKAVPRVRADLDGRWAGVCGAPDTSGSWRLAARLENEGGGDLLTTETLAPFTVASPSATPLPTPSVAVSEAPIERSTPFPTLAAALVPLAVLLCGALALAIVWRRQDRALHARVGAAAADAEEVLRVGKESLRADIIAAAAALNALAERRALTPDEQSRRNSLADALMSLESTSTRPVGVLVPPEQPKTP